MDIEEDEKEDYAHWPSYIWENPSYEQEKANLIEEGWEKADAEKEAEGRHWQRIRVRKHFANRRYYSKSVFRCERSSTFLIYYLLGIMKTFSRNLSRRTRGMFISFIDIDNNTNYVDALLICVRPN